MRGNWNKHFDIVGKHAAFSPSKYTWINKSDEEILETIKNLNAASLGTKLHMAAASDIELNLKRPKNHQTFNMYVNDAIGFKMDPEVPLKYTNDIFGTTDAILFSKGQLRIHDLKTGKTPAHMEQLAIYAALFLLEYGQTFGIRPKDISTELRIYQNDEIIIDHPEVDYLEFLMEKITHIDDFIRMMNEEDPTWIIT